MPTYYAGWINGIMGTPRAGSGFTMVHLGGSGIYTITIPSMPSGHFPVVVASALQPDTVARITGLSVDGMTHISTLVVEVFVLSTGAHVDADFSFIAIERS
jgi:hypothetical protein